jgi:hypothetical protein
MNFEDFNSPDQVAAHINNLTRQIHMQQMVIESYRMALMRFATHCDKMGQGMTNDMSDFISQFSKTVNSTQLEHLEANYEKLYNTYMNI